MNNNIRSRDKLSEADCRALIENFPAASGRKTLLYAFHRWLKQQKISLRKLTKADIELFCERPRGELLLEDTRLNYLSLVFRYVSYLRDHGLTRCAPSRRPLPSVATEFLETVSLTRKHSTCNGYKHALRRFYLFLDRYHIVLKKLRRQDVVSFLISLKESNLHPSSRLHIVWVVRTYVRWLHESNRLDADPETLFYRSDLPKLPNYLPRPLPPDIDVKLRAKLEQSPTIYAQALLLMRHTGIRIGELIALPYDCLLVDMNNNVFLKVPLGKMNSERNVPIDSNTQKLVTSIQQTLPLNRTWLLPRHRACHPSTLRTKLFSELRVAATGLTTNAPITSHRLRHTYATSLLNAGMSLLGLMRLLGHKDYRMTLRYAAISQETVRHEYFAALENLKLPIPSTAQNSPKARTPSDILDEAIHAISKIALDKKLPSPVHRQIEKRLRRVAKTLLAIGQ